MISEVDAAYIAGLFDGEGSVTYKQYTENKFNRARNKRYKTKVWRIALEISMTDKSVLIWLHETLGFNQLIIMVCVFKLVRELLVGFVYFCIIE